MGLYGKLGSGVGDANIGITVDSMGTGNPNFGRRIAQKYAALYPEVTVHYRRYLEPAEVTTTPSNAIQLIQTGRNGQILTVWNGTKPGTSVAYQTTNYDTIFPVDLDVMIINNGHNYGVTDPDPFVAAIQDYAQFVKGKNTEVAIWIASQALEMPPAILAQRTKHYDRQIALRTWARATGYPYVPILEAFDARTPDLARLIQSDGIHPTNQDTVPDGSRGYELWATVFDKFISDMSKDYPGPPYVPPVIPDPDPDPEPVEREIIVAEFPVPQGYGIPLVDQATLLLPPPMMDKLDQRFLTGTEVWRDATTIYVPKNGVGIDPRGYLDSTAAIQPLYLEAQSRGMKLKFADGTYWVRLVSEKTVMQPVVEGVGKGTILKGGGAGNPIITMRGQSGQNSFGRIRNLQVTNPGGTSLVLEGCIGVLVQNVRFNAAETGLLFFNNAYGDYTEFCWTEGCTFEQGCKRGIEYRRNNGDASFHGTGFKDTVFNQTSADWGKEAVYVGAGCTVYNAPWDGMFFIGNPGQPPIRNDSGTPVRCHGNLSVEGKPDTVSSIVHNSSVSPVYLGGHINRLSSNSGAIRRGIRLYLVEDVTYYGTSSLNVSHHKKPYEFVQDMVSGQNTIPEITIDNAQSYLVAVRIQGSGYTQHALLYITMNNSNTTGTVAVIVAPTQGFQTDDNNIAAPAFSMPGKNLVVTKTNPPAGTKMYFKITPQHSNSSHPLV